MSAVKKGRTGYLGVSAGGVAENDFDELTIAQDVTLGLTKDAADATSRAAGGWKQELAVLKNCEVTVTALWDDTDAVLQEILDRWLDDEIVGIRALDSSTGQGVEADMCVHDFSISQPIAGIQTVSIVLKPAPSATAPTWYTGA